MGRIWELRNFERVDGRVVPLERLFFLLLSMPSFHQRVTTTHNTKQWELKDRQGHGSTPTTDLDTKKTAALNTDLMGYTNSRPL